MLDPKSKYYLKKYYHNIIKWWFVAYDSNAKKVWPSKEEAELAAEQERLEEEARLREEARIAAEKMQEEERLRQEAIILNAASGDSVPEDAYNEATASYSGLYGKGPVDSDTESALAEIMQKSRPQDNIDSLFQQTSAKASKADAPELPPEQEAIIHEANAIYARLLKEAAEDEAKKTAEIEAAKEAANS